MRSSLKPGPMLDGTEKGPFGISFAEWAYFGNRTDFGVEFPVEALDEWRSQSLVSALRLMLVQNQLTDALGRGPSWAEVALALMCGADATAAALKDATKKIVNAISSGAGDRGVDTVNMQARFGEFVDNETGAGAAEKIAVKLQASVDTTRPLIEALMPVDGSGQATIIDLKDKVSTGATPVTGILIEVSATDLDALARVAKSEVGHFAKYGEDQLRGGLSAVVDTIFNRVAHASYPNNIQKVIDQKRQFSAINPLGTWAKLPVAPQKIFDIVSVHVDARAGGAASIIAGATHFLNPFRASKLSMKQWGQFVVDHAVEMCISTALRSAQENPENMSSSAAVTRFSSQLTVCRPRMFPASP